MRLLAGTRSDRPLTHAEHLVVHGPLPRSFDAALEDAGLRGRGGAGFPVARKLAVARAARGRPVVVVNATESEPASLKDTTLLQRAPHLVLDGALVAAGAVRARDVTIAVHAGGAATAPVRAALAEHPQAGRVRLVEVPSRYVSGDASSVARAAAGGPALPFYREKPLAVEGPGGRPTLVLNAESLAGLALLVRHGAGWYSAVGTPEEPGTLLATIRRTGHAPAVVELPVGTTVGAALDLVGVDVSALQAVLVGGWFGRWLAMPEAAATPLSHAGLREAGGVLGAGVVVGLGRDECGLRSTAEVARRLARESAGQCGPCLNGLPALARALEDLVSGFDLSDARQRVSNYRSLVRRRGLCGLPDGSADLAGSALEVFLDDVLAHGQGGCGRPSTEALALLERAAVPAGGSA